MLTADAMKDTLDFFLHGVARAGDLCIGLLYDFNIDVTITYDPATGKEIISNPTYDFKEPCDVYGDFKGDPDYRRAVIDRSQFDEYFTPDAPTYSWDAENKILTATANNIRSIFFEEASLLWPKPITHIGIFDSTDLTTKKLRAYAVLDEAKTVALETVPLFKMGAFQVTTN